MNLNNLKIDDNLVPPNYLQLALDANKCKESAARELLEKKKLPKQGWNDEEIEAILHQLSSLDSNNFSGRAGLGEREARIICSLVARRHYNFGHGIGRSGDLLEAQPKAAGSTLIANLTNALLCDLIREMGVRSCHSCFLVPMATGMTLTLCMLALRKLRPQAQYVLWSRIDQKSCFKSITAAGLTPIIVDTVLTENNDLTTDMAAFERKIRELGPAAVLCCYSTTSCFAPRNCDDIVALAKMAQFFKLPHLVNNAYGLQSTFLTHQLEQAYRTGRVDLFVQSTDKNLMVPVGGAIVASFDDKMLKTVATTYVGRASSSQTLDVFMTLLSLGKNGYMKLVKERKTNFDYLRSRLQTFAASHNAAVINSKQNRISLALTLNSLLKETTRANTNLTQFGSMLYTRGVSGVRVILPGDDKMIDGYKFYNWGAHNASAQIPYLTVAAALGITSEEIDVFFKKLENCWRQFFKKNGD